MQARHAYTNWVFTSFVVDAETKLSERVHGRRAPADALELPAPIVTGCHALARIRDKTSLLAHSSNR